MAGTPTRRNVLTDASSREDSGSQASQLWNGKNGRMERGARAPRHRGIVPGRDLPERQGRGHCRNDRPRTSSRPTWDVTFELRVLVSATPGLAPRGARTTPAHVRHLTGWQGRRP